MVIHKADIDLAVSDDGLEVKVREYNPPSGNGPPLTEKQVLARLKHLGVKIDIDHDLVHKVVAKAVSGADITGMPVLVGSPPGRAGSLYFKPAGNPEFPVFKGMVIGSIEKYLKNVPGLDVFNQKIMPDDKQPPRDVQIGKGCVLDKKTGKLIARGYGQVQAGKTSVSIKPLFRISPDRTRLTCVIFAADYFGKEITQERVLASLQDMNLAETIEHKAIQENLSRARKTQTPQIAVVARGRPPLNGRDGYFDPSEAIKPPDIDVSDVNVKVDYREQSIFKTVRENTFLGRIYPPETGQDGHDVFGKVIPARPGKDAELRPGKNVEITDDGSLTSLISGLVVFENHTISVLEFMTINGDVDLSTGNIRLESGSVEITGSIKEGFVVQSPEHILVHENIEEARVSALGNIEVNLGVVMKGEGKISAGGMFRCKFAENASIQAKGNFHFTSNLNNCLVSCQGAVLGGEKGIIMGGMVRAEKHMEVFQVGSDYGIKTKLYIGPREKNTKKLAEEKDKLLKHLNEIKDILLKNAMENKSGKLSDEDKNKARELMNTYNKIQERIKKINALIRDKSITEEDAGRYYLRIKDIAYPGTSIHFLGKTLDLTETVKGARFFYDPARKVITWK